MKVYFRNCMCCLKWAEISKYIRRGLPGQIRIGEKILSPGEIGKRCQHRTGLVPLVHSLRSSMFRWINLLIPSDEKSSNNLSVLGKSVAQSRSTTSSQMFNRKPPRTQSFKLWWRKYSKIIRTHRMLRISVFQITCLFPNSSYRFKILTIQILKLKSRNRNIISQLSNSNSRSPSPLWVTLSWYKIKSKVKRWIGQIPA